MANPNGNIENLNPVRSKEEARILGQKGGFASGEARRNKKTYTNAVKWLTNADIKITKGKIKETLEANGISTKGLDTTQLATLGLWLGAVYGNAQNFKTLMETNGENIEEENTYMPEIERLGEIVDNSHLDKDLYEADKH
jgi:hypothetical protein